MNKREFKILNGMITETAMNSYRALLFKFFQENQLNNSVCFNNENHTKCYQIEDKLVYPTKLFIDECDKLTLLFDIEYLKEGHTNVENLVRWVEDLDYVDLGLLCSFIQSNYYINKKYTNISYVL
jgi:hypothetical protein